MPQYSLPESQLCLQTLKSTENECDDVLMDPVLFLRMCCNELMDHSNDSVITFDEEFVDHKNLAESRLITHVFGFLQFWVLEVGLQVRIW